MLLNFIWPYILLLMQLSIQSMTTPPHRVCSTQYTGSYYSNPLKCGTWVFTWERALACDTSLVVFNFYTRDMQGLFGASLS